MNLKINGRFDMQQLKFEKVVKHIHKNSNQNCVLFYNFFSNFIVDSHPTQTFFFTLQFSSLPFYTKCYKIYFHSTCENKKFHHKNEFREKEKNFKIAEQFFPFLRLYSLEQLRSYFSCTYTETEHIYTQ